MSLKNKTCFVVKVGGSLLTHPERFTNFAKDIAALRETGQKVIVIHGGGPHISKALNEAQLPSVVIEGYRQTTKEMMPLVENVLIGQVYQQLRQACQQAGLKVPIISTASDVPVLATQKRTPDGVPVWGLVGSTESLQVDVLKSWLEADLVPILPSVACDASGQSLNINADELAAFVASSIGAQALIVLTDTNGVYMDGSNKNSRVPSLNPQEAQHLITSGVIHSGMIPKVQHCLKALEKQVNKVCLIDGAMTGALLFAAYGSHDMGTVFTDHITTDYNHDINSNYREETPCKSISNF